MALDEATAALLAEMAAMGAPPLHEQTPSQARDTRAARRAQAPPGPAVAAVRDTRVRVSGGYAPVRVLTPDGTGGGAPAGRTRGVIVWYHGGGWVLGGLEDADPVGRTLAHRTGCTVVMVDYRLAPEYRYPTAVDDSWAALRWVAGRLPELAGAPAPADGAGQPRGAGPADGAGQPDGAGPADGAGQPDGAGPADGAVPLIVAGDSAGGNLAAIMAQRAKRAGGPAIAAQILVYPVTDCDLNTLSYLDPANQLLLSRESMTWFWDHYAPLPEARAHPDASPMHATDLMRLPPAVVLTAEHDVLRDEGELYATRLLKSQVPVRHRRFAGQMHGFFTMVGILPGAAAGMDFVADSLAGLLPAPARD